MVAVELTSVAMEAGSSGQVAVEETSAATVVAVDLSTETVAVAWLQSGGRVWRLQLRWIH